ncbi:MAG: lipase family protein [Bacteroidota bacterium]
MKFRLLSYCLFICLAIDFSSILSQSRGDLISSQLIGTRTQSEIETIYAQFGIPVFLSPIQYDVDLYKLVYFTPDASGENLTIASGLVMVPVGECDFPLFCYNHGTSLYGTPISSLGGEWQIGIFFATSGYLAVLPDYLGMGDTPLDHPHPYIHAKSEATAVVDMLRASRIFCTNQEIRLNEQVFLSGYSQGGHVAMAAFKEMELLHSDEFQLTAAAPASGPYDVSRTTRDTLLLNQPSATGSFYLSYVLTSYQFVYGNMWTTPSDVFVPPYDVQIPAFFDRQSPQSGVVFPDTARTMFWPALVDSLQEDSLNLHPINQALAENDVYDWTPNAPVRMFYCEADEQVPYYNAFVAQNQFVANGSSSSSIVSSGASLGHQDCAPPSLLLTKAWFDSLRVDCTADSVTSIDRDWRQHVQVFPNPFSGNLNILQSGNRKKSIHRVQVVDLQGRVIVEKELVPYLPEQTLHFPELHAGSYVFKWIGLQWSGYQILQVH